MKKTVFVFSALIVALLLLFKLSEYTYLSGNISIEIAIGTVAIVFFIVGIYINKKSLKKEKIDFIDHQKIEELGFQPSNF